jgi:hypothetical protein
MALNGLSWPWRGVFSLFFWSPTADLPRFLPAPVRGRSEHSPDVVIVTPLSRLTGCRGWRGGGGVGRPPLGPYLGISLFFFFFFFFLLFFLFFYLFLVFFFCLFALVPGGLSVRLVVDAAPCASVRMFPTQVQIVITCVAPPPSIGVLCQTIRLFRFFLLPRGHRREEEANLSDACIYHVLFFSPGNMTIILSNDGENIFHHFMELILFFNDHSFSHPTLVYIMFGIFCVAIFLVLLLALLRKYYYGSSLSMDLLIGIACAFAIYIGIFALAAANATLIGPVPGVIDLWNVSLDPVDVEGCSPPECVLREGSQYAIVPQTAVHGFMMNFQLLAASSPVISTKTARLTLRSQTTFGLLTIGVYPGHTVRVESDFFPTVVMPWSDHYGTFNTKQLRHDVHRISFWFGRYDSAVCKGDSPKCLCLQLYTNNAFRAAFPVPHIHDRRGVAATAFQRVNISVDGSVGSWSPEFDLQSCDALVKQRFPKSTKILHVLGAMGAVIVLHLAGFALVYKYESFVRDLFTDSSHQSAPRNNIRSQKRN